MVVTMEVKSTYDCQWPSLQQSMKPHDWELIVNQASIGAQREDEAAHDGWVMVTDGCEKPDRIPTSSAWTNRTHAPNTGPLKQFVSRENLVSTDPEEQQRVDAHKESKQRARSKSLKKVRFSAEISSQGQDGDH